MATPETLLTALSAFQAAVPPMPKDAKNPAFRSKYTSLDAIVERVGPILAENGLVWSTFPCVSDAGIPSLRYSLSHAASGESTGGTMSLLLSKSDPQGQGSAITYARRYALTCVLNLAADEDDDGNAAVPARQSRPALVKQRESAPAPGQASGQPSALSAEQRRDLGELYSATDWTGADLALLLVASDALKGAAVDALGSNPSADDYSKLIGPAMAALTPEQFEMVKGNLETAVAQQAAA